MRLISRLHSGNSALGLALAAVLLIAACGGSAPLDDDAKATITEEVRKVLEDYNRRLNDQEFKGALEHFADDPRFYWVEDGTARYSSREEIGAGYAQLEGMGKLRVDRSSPRITVLSNDIATAFATHRTTIGDPAAGGFSFAGAMTVTLVRTEKGWQFLSGHTSTERPRGR